ncbi:MAG: GerMN domain-containing protein [Syntrophomonadaceae bacterium]|nr:GerMN domain-containing protein [Syntrophomonadaceae bacterium]
MWGKKIIAGMLVLLLPGILGGCSKLPFWPASSSGDNQFAAVSATAPAEINIDEGQPAGPMVAVDLYFADLEKDQLVPEKRNIPKVVGIARATVEELLKGPAADSGLRSAIPPGTSLLDINVRTDGLCIVDLSREMRSQALDPMEESLAVYSVVNTLTQFPTVKRVQILVNGQKVESLNGAVLISQPLVRDEDLIGKLASLK